MHPEELIGENVWIRTKRHFYHADIVSVNADTVTIDCGDKAVLEKNEIESILTKKDAADNCARNDFFHIDLIP